jgi:hypothetical protein
MENKKKKKKPTNVYHVKISIKAIERGYKQLIFQGLVYECSNEEAVKLAISKIKEEIMLNNIESDYKLMSCVKLRTDFIFSPKKEE